MMSGRSEIAGWMVPRQDSCWTVAMGLTKYIRSTPRDQLGENAFAGAGRWRCSDLSKIRRFPTGCC